MSQSRLYAVCFRSLGDLNCDLKVSVEPFLSRVNLSVISIRKQRAQRVLGGVEHNEYSNELARCGEGV